VRNFERFFKNIFFQKIFKPMKASVAGLTYGCDIFIATCGRLSQFVEEKYVC